MMSTVQEHWEIIGEIWNVLELEQLIREHLPDTQLWRFDRLLRSMAKLDGEIDALDYGVDDVFDGIIDEMLKRPEPSEPAKVQA